jgi:hypothetical protein
VFLICTFWKGFGHLLQPLLENPVMINNRRRDKRSNKWIVQIKPRGQKTKHIGSFDELDLAISARKAAEVKHGFHKNHGA